MPTPAKTKRIPYGSGRPVLGRKFCKTCGRWRLLVDYSVTQRSKGQIVSWSNVCKTCTRIDQQARRDDPIRGAAKREYDRIWYEGRRRSMGIKPRNFGPKSRRPIQPVTSHANVVDATELIEFMEGWVEHHRVEFAIGESGQWDANHGWEEISTRSGVSSRSLRRIRQMGRVHIANADKILVALDGPPLAVLYPDD